MKRTIERRLQRLEAKQEDLSIEELARRVAREAGISVDELMAESEAMMAECQRLGLTTVDAVIDHVAAKEGITPEELRQEMDALEARGQ